MMDGHLNKCKECTKSDSNARVEYLRENDPEFVKNEKIRGREKYHRLYKGIPTPKNVKKKSIGNYIERYPEKRNAKLHSQHIPCPENCERHHWSYNEEHYKDVIILPITLHNKIHRYMSYDSRSKMYKTSEGTLLDTRQKHELFISKIAELF